MVVKGTKVPFEEALNLTGYSRYNVYLFLLCSSIIIGMTFEIFSVSYLVPASSCELNTTSAQQGLMAAVPLMGVIATSQVWGYMADTKGRRKILIVSMTSAFITGMASAFSPNWIALSVFKLLSSASVAGSFALSMTLLSECTPAAKRSLMVLLTTSVHLASMGFMAVIVIPVLPLKFSYHIPFLGIYFNAWRLLTLIFTVPCAISAIGCACAYESPKYLISVGKDEEALEVLRGMYVINTGNSPDDYKVHALDLGEERSSALHKGFWGSIVAQTIPMIKPPLLRHTVLMSSLFVITYICINSFFVWLPFILDAFMSSVLAGERHISLCEMIRLSSNNTSFEEVQDCSMNSVAMSMVFGIDIILAVFNIFMSSLLNCVGRKTLYISIQLISGAAALTLNSSPFWILSAVQFMVFLSGICNFGLLSSVSVEVFPTYVRAMAVCLTLMFGRGSAVGGINLLKRLLDSNCEAAFYIFGSVAVSGGLLGLLLPSSEKTKQIEKPQNA